MQSRNAKATTQDAVENRVERIHPEASDCEPVRDEKAPNSNLQAPESKRELHPELREFIERVIVPILVDKYMEEVVKPRAMGSSGKRSEPAARRDFLTIPQLAERWSCSRGTVYNVLRSTGTKVVDFAPKGRKGHKLVPVATVEEIERRRLKRLS